MCECLHLAPRDLNPNNNPSILLSSLWVSHTGSASDWCALQEALYKCINTIQYNISHCFFLSINGSETLWHRSSFADDLLEFKCYIPDAYKRFLILLIKLFYLVVLQISM